MEQLSPRSTATELAHHNDRTRAPRAYAPQQEKPPHEKPGHHKEESSPLATTRESPRGSEDPAQPKINKEVIVKGLNVHKYQEGETNQNRQYLRKTNNEG